MDVYLSREQLDLRSEVRAFLDEQYPPERILQMEQDEEYPEDFYRECAKRGWTGIPVPPEHGGSGGSVLDLCVFVEEVGRTSISLSTLYITGTIFGSHALHICGSEEQASRYLPAIVSGEKRFALAMSEPGAGSDFAGMETRAERVDGGWRIDGLKGPISGAERAEIIITAARTSSDPDGPRQKGISLFLVENGPEGPRFERTRYAAMRALMVNKVHYEGVVVPDSALLGPADEGWMNLVRLMDPERLANAAQTIGVAQAAIDDGIACATSRRQYGEPISRYQAVSHPLAEAQAEVTAARLLVYAAAHKRDVEGPCPKEASMAKMLANNVAARATNAALQCAGARGYERDSHFMRRVLEVRGCELGGGTSQIQRNIIARFMGLGLNAIEEVPMGDEILVEVDDGVGTITLNRPERLNTLAISTVDRLVDALAAVGADPGVRAVVLAGAGKRFCAGADQAEMVERDPQAWEPIVRRYLDPVRAIVGMDKPIIAALHGDAVGGGLGLALACDFRLAAEGVRMGAPFTPIGLAGCDMSAGWFLPRLVGLGTASDLMFTGRLVSAPEALAIGLVHRVVPPERFDAEVSELAGRLAAGPPIAHRWTKRALHRSLGVAMDAEFEFEIFAQVQCIQSEDHREGVSAFQEKRAPVFRGR